MSATLLDIDELKSKVDTTAQWQVCRMSVENRQRLTFASHIRLEPDGICSCFIQWDQPRTPPMVGISSSALLRQQCREQGFQDITLDKLFDHLTQVDSQMLYNVTSNNMQLEFNVQLSSTPDENMMLRLRIPVVGVECCDLAARLYNNLLGQVITSSTILMLISQEQKALLRRKDDTIQYLLDTVNDLGGYNIIERWAPGGSLNDYLLRRTGVDDSSNNVLNKLREINIEDDIEGTIDVLMNKYYLSWRAKKDSKWTDNRNNEQSATRKRSFSFSRYPAMKREDSSGDDNDISTDLSKIEGSTTSLTNLSSPSPSESGITVKDEDNVRTSMSKSSSDTSTSPKRKRRRVFGKIKINK